MGTYISTVTVSRQKLIDAYSLMNSYLNSYPNVKLTNFGSIMRQNEPRIKNALQEWFDISIDLQNEYLYAQQDFAVKDKDGVPLTHPAAGQFGGQQDVFNIPADKQKELNKLLAQIQKKYEKKQQDYLYDDEGKEHTVTLKVVQAKQYPAFQPLLQADGRGQQKVHATPDDLKHVFMGILLNSESQELKPVELIKA